MEMINSFCELTGANKEEARYYLQSSSWMLEDAVNLYFTAEDHPVQQAQVKKSKGIKDDVAKKIWAPNKGGSSKSSASGKNLDSLFNPPFSLMYQGSFDQAREAAKLQKKWLMVNLQSRDEFSSFMLNRDTWSDESVQDAISAGFIFWQIYNHEYESKKVCTYYLVSSFPTILIIDPITGQQMHAWTGCIEPSKLMNVLLQYSLKNPNDCLQATGHNTLKESTSKTAEYVELEHVKEDSEDYGGDSTEDYSDYGNDPEYNINEDIGYDNEADENETEHAVENTDEEVKPVENIADNYYEENMEEDKNEEIYLSNTEEQRFTHLPLPEEPLVAKELLCRIGVRFPDGRRLQRNFMRTDSIKLLWSLCLSKMEEKEMSTPFYFMHSIPGAPSKSLVFGSDQNFEEAGLCNALVILVWLL